MLPSSEQTVNIYDSGTLANVNLNKVDIFYGIVLIPLVLLSMYNFIILTMRLCAQRNSCPKELNEARVTDKQRTNSAPSRDLL